MAEGEREPCRGPQRDERQSRDRQLGHAAQPAWGAVVIQDARPAPGIEGFIAATGRLHEAQALLPVRPFHSCLLQRYPLVTGARKIETPTARHLLRLIDVWRRPEGAC